MSVCLSVCITALVIPANAKRIFPAQHYIVTCDLPRCTIFSTLSHKQHDFLGEKLLYVKCV